MSKKGNTPQYGKKYPLAVYRLIARRYRPAGYLLFIFGLLMELPRFITELRPRNSILTYEQLSIVGLIAIVSGVIIVIASIYEERRAYVQCLPDYLLINTAAGRVAVAYQRFNTFKSVRVGDMYPWKEYRGRQRDFIRPFAAETAIEAVVKEWPLPERAIRKRLSPFVISARDTGFIFIVPRATDFRMEIDRYVDQARTAIKEAEAEKYSDPIERMRRQEKRTFR